MTEPQVQLEQREPLGVWPTVLGLLILAFLSLVSLVVPSVKRKLREEDIDDQYHNHSGE